MLSNILMGKRRKKNQLPKVKDFEHYTVQNERKVYSFIFPKVRGVVHHGGCTTNGRGFWAVCPSLIIPLAFDQWYYGRCVQELVSGKYDARAKKLSETIRGENGIDEAIGAIEEYVRKVR